MWKWWFSLFARVCVYASVCVRGVHEQCCKLCGGLSGKKQGQNKTCRGLKDVCAC